MELENKNTALETRGFDPAGCVWGRTHRPAVQTLEVQQTFLQSDFLQHHLSLSHLLHTVQRWHHIRLISENWISADTDVNLI